MARLRRLSNAVLSNIDSWIEHVHEIEEHAIPATGNKPRALHLIRNMMQARAALKRLLLSEREN